MNKYVVTITEVGNSDESSSTICYQQTVDTLDIQSVIAAVNSSPVPAREPRKRAKRSDAGKPRGLRSTASNSTATL
jgi:hypothetical protein